MAEADSFLYFAFGSNLSSERIRKNSPSAAFVSIARLPGYDLRFCGYASENWKGATATIWKEEGAEMWGVVWRISNEHSDALNRYSQTNLLYSYSSQAHRHKVVILTGRSACSAATCSFFCLYVYIQSHRATSDISVDAM